MEAASALQSQKAARGTKRLCDACQVRFYDLLRDPIVCPSCGAQHTPMVHVAEGGRRSADGRKSGWRQNVEKPRPVPDAAIVADPEVAAGEELEMATENATEPIADDEIVLEHEADDGDVSGLVDHDVEEPKEG